MIVGSQVQRRDAADTLYCPLLAGKKRSVTQFKLTKSDYRFFIIRAQH